MKQILQNLKSGNTEIANVPCPAVGHGNVLIGTSCTLISAGTERMLVEFGKAGWIEKARQKPDKVRMVIDKIKTDGLIPTLESVFNKLGQPLPLGYCNVGKVLEAGSGNIIFKTGDRVASNGKHAAAVNVPFNLCAKIPDSVTDDEASFTVLGAIALQGIRLAKPSLGECVVVAGLGLIGLLTVQLLIAQGCRVIGLDFDNNKLALAKKFGAEVVNLNLGEDPLLAVQSFSRDRGSDVVIITASTNSNELVHQAALMCRKRGRIILVGVTGLELSRSDFYEKELTFQVSCSYGPGRYDPVYEDKGIDYPVGFVRWTAQRNFEAVLDMMATGRLDVKSLISHRYDINEAEKAYELISSSEQSLGILLDYQNDDKSDSLVRMQTVKLSSTSTKGIKTSEPNVAFIGSGNYATAVLIPAFKATGATLKTVVSLNGVSGLHAGRKFGFESTTTDTESVFKSDGVNTIVIATKHDSHANLVCAALNSGKNVFVEKPLALKLKELEEIENATKVNNTILMVGFNRRFAPQIQKIKELISTDLGPKTFILTVNAGLIPPTHWTQEREVGGGRIIGEACHFIDLLLFLAGASLKEHNSMVMKSLSGDTVSINLKFSDGSIGTIHYFANGSKSFPKERLDVFTNGRVLQLNNYRKLIGFGWPNFKKMNLWRQDKGQKACALAFIQAIKKGEDSPISLKELFESSRVSIEVAEELGY
ncbi:MAG: dehydrogenase [Planctomycetota bacterium]|nr:MAG: dehydrogenase [Planctomycetota bacterium]